jgi:hypothetical protein
MPGGKISPAGALKNVAGQQIGPGEYNGARTGGILVLVFLDFRSPVKLCENS